MTRYQKFLSVIFLITWIWAAYHPMDPKEWLLENILVLIFVGVLLFTAKYFKFSNTSYTFITIFLVLHLAGGHYGYTQTPFGYTIRDWLGETRNMYDRFMHLLFGISFSYPCFEVAEQVMGTKHFSNYYITLLSILGASAVYEILEWLAVRNIDVNASLYFVGAQGDNWDTQKDMAMATVGALVAIVVIYCMRKYNKRKLHG